MSLRMMLITMPKKKQSKYVANTFSIFILQGDAFYQLSGPIDSEGVLF